MRSPALFIITGAVLMTAPGVTGADAARDKQVRWGKGYLQGVPQRPTSTTHFEIYSDVSEPRAITSVGQNLEATFAVIARSLAAAHKPIPTDEKTIVFVYGSRDAFNGFRQQLGIPGESFVGLCFPTGVLAFTMETGSIGNLRSAMIHEAAHAYLGTLTRPGRIVLPKWLDEGYATYVDHSEIRDGEMILGSRVGSTSYTIHGTGFHETSLSKVGAKTIRSARKKGELIPIERLMRAGGEEFYGERATLYYAQAWALVHFLVHGQADWEGQRFPVLIQRVVEGEPARDAVRIVYGLDGEKLNSAYLEYLKTF